MKDCSQASGVFVGIAVSVAVGAGVSVNTEVGDGNGVSLGIGVSVGVLVGRGVSEGVGVAPPHKFDADDELRGVEGFAISKSAELLSVS